MVTIKNSIKVAAIPLAVTSFMILQGCNKDEEENVSANTNLLIGDWKLTEVDGYDYSSPDYSFYSNSKVEVHFSNVMNILLRQQIIIVMMEPGNGKIAMKIVS